VCSCRREEQRQEAVVGPTSAGDAAVGPRVAAGGAEGPRAARPRQ
jgi:hypothetical protein